MWEKIKKELKELRSIIKIAAGFGLASDLALMFLRPEYYSREFPPFFCTWSYPVLAVTGIIMMAIIVRPIFILIFSTFWIWAWSIVSIILVSLI